MLTNLNIKDFAIVEQLNLEFEKGLISLTGETGAGKSIILGAINLIIGGNSNKKTVRAGTEKAIVSGTFDISKLENVKNKISENDLIGDSEDECIIRRVIKKNGRSSAFINDNAVNLAKLKEIGSLLIEIHGQNESLNLSENNRQLELLDTFLGLKPLKRNVSELYKEWKLKEKKYNNIKENFDTDYNAYQLLKYQLSELEELNSTESEYDLLEDEFKMLNSAKEVFEKCENSLTLLNGDSDGNISGAIDILNTAFNNIEDLEETEELVEIKKMLEIASINISETLKPIFDYKEKFEINPEKQNEVKQRISEIDRIANKMNVLPEDVWKLKNEILENIEKLSFSEDAVDNAKEELKESFDAYEKAAVHLSEKRKEKSFEMELSVNKEAVKLNLSEDILKIVFDEKCAKTSSGIDKIIFYIRPNLGQEYQPLKEIASGGEISRIALAVQVVCLKNENIPTMIFDEVDAGLSGETGNEVGRMLRKLGDVGQIMCVTHLPQVASQGHSHYLVSKRNVKRGDDEITISSIKSLEEQERILEIARMIGGDINSRESFDSAKLMISKFSNQQ